MSTRPHFIVVGDQFVGALTLFKSESITVIMIPNLVASNPPDDLAGRIRSLARPGTMVIFAAGNVDVQIEAYRQAIFHPRSLARGSHTVTVTDFERYALRGAYSWCHWIRNLALTVAVVVCGAILPTVTDEYIAPSLNMYLNTKRHPVRMHVVNKWVADHTEIVTMAMRTSFVQTWNGFLAAACAQVIKRGSPTARDRPHVEPSGPLVYIDLNDDMLDATGAIANVYRHQTLINHTLIWEPTIDLWKARLDLTDDDLVEPCSDKYIRQKRVQIDHYMRT